MIKLKRVYENPERKDGVRVLVDRLWPRGISRKRADIHEWSKEIAPSRQLRKWFGHDPAKWNLFRTRYLEELKARKEALKQLKIKFSGKTMTFIYAAHDIKHNNAVVLKQVLEKIKVK